MTPEEEQELVTESTKGDAQAFTDLVRFLTPSLMRFLYSLLGNLESAEEVAQLSFLRAHTKIDKLKDPARFKAWLWRIARYAAFDRVRMERRRGPEPDSLENLGMDVGSPSLATPENQMIRFDMIVQAREHIDRLPLELREVLILRYEEELTYQEIADHFGLTLFQVKARLARARSELRPSLADLADEWRRFFDEKS
ncbi:MAG: RNA polymerase sigma factor (sigma-70 family) [Planctomycetota bacterium]|jgi:RNA polymerase sigma factor (sigma-70 family)